MKSWNEFYRCGNTTTKGKEVKKCRVDGGTGVAQLNLIHKEGMTREIACNSAVILEPDLSLFFGFFWLGTY